MNAFPLAHPELFNWVILPLLIFFARVADVSLGTLRIIFVSKGLRILAPIFGFFEVIIWLMAISQIMQNMNNVSCYIAYGAGFAAGNWVGILLSERLSIGFEIVRIITKKDASELIEDLRQNGYGVTSIPAEGASGGVHLIFSLVNRSDLGRVVQSIRKFNPRAFYSVEDVRMVAEGVFPAKTPFFRKNYLKMFMLRRKGK